VDHAFCPVQKEIIILEKKNENIISEKREKKIKKVALEKVIKEGKERCGQNFGNEVIEGPPHVNNSVNHKGWIYFTFFFLKRK